MEPTLYPIYLILKDKPCLVVGGGGVAGRKVFTLIEAGASVTVVSPEISDEIRSLTDGGEVRYIEGDFLDEHLDGCALVIGATDDPAVNRAVSDGARRRGILVNIVDSPEESDFYVPSLVKSGSLTLAISTGGKSPAMAKRVRKDLEKTIGEEYAQMIDFLGRLRGDAFSAIAEEKDRASLFTRMADSCITSLIREGALEKAREEAEQILNRFGMPYKKEYLG